ncbi:MAG: hypothetical protein ABWJ97_05650 [Thermoproteus sp.]
MLRKLTPYTDSPIERGTSTGASPVLLRYTRRRAPPTEMFIGLTGPV